MAAWGRMLGAATLGSAAMSAGEPFSAQVAAALARGDTLEAIRLIRASGGQGLREALASVEAHSARRSQAGPGASSGVQAAIGDALQQGNVIEAIKRMRAANPGMDLKSAKHAVDALRRNATMSSAGGDTQARAVQAKAARTPTVVEGDHGGYGVVFVAIAAAVAALAWWFVSAG